ncbi:MAG: aminotransferase class IV [Bacteroidota bacterium]
MRDTSTKEQLLESIRLIDGHFPLLDYHQERVDRSRKLLFPKAPGLKLRKILAEAQYPQQGLFKARIIYGQELEELQFIPYKPKEVTSLKVVEANHIRYPKKLANRVAINELLAKRGHCDDILMTLSGFLTDASYANIALFDGSTWYTPAVPLLRGTRRAYLLHKGTIKTAVIRKKDLHYFECLRLMNSMLPWHEAPTIPIDNIMD